MSEAPRSPPSTPTDPATAEDLTVIREQTREILELVRSLVGMLLPKDDDEGPKLEDLIAALIAQQRDILVATRQIQSDQQAILKHLVGNGVDGAVREQMNGGARI